MKKITLSFALLALTLTLSAQKKVTDSTKVPVTLTMLQWQGIANLVHTKLPGEVSDPIIADMNKSIATFINDTVKVQVAQPSPQKSKKSK